MGCESGREEYLLKVPLYLGIEQAKSVHTFTSFYILLMVLAVKELFVTFESYSFFMS